jgi:hypothetical protein
VATSREIALAVDLVLVQETEIITVIADAAEDQGQDLDQAALAATLLAMEEDITRGATLPRETRVREGVVAASLLTLANAHAAILAAIAEETLALLPAQRAPAMIEDLSLQEKLSQMATPQRSTRTHLRLLQSTAKLTRKNKPSEAQDIQETIKDSFLICYLHKSRLLRISNQR